MPGNSLMISKRLMMSRVLGSSKERDGRWIWNCGGNGSGLEIMGVLL